MADDQQPPAQRSWFPYWTAPPQPPPPAPAPRPAVRPQLSRRDTRPAPQPSPPVTPSPSRRQSHPQPATTPASRGAGAPPPPAQPQPTRLSSRPSPSPARAPPLSPIREPNARAAPAPAPVPIAKEPKPAIAHPTTAHEVPKQKDIIIPLEKTIHEPPADSKSKPHSKAVEKEKDKEEEKEKEKDKEKKEKEKEKDKEKEKEKKKEKEKDKEKDKEKEHKEKKDKEKEHKEKEKDKEDIKSKEVVGEHGSKLHKELKAGVADMVHKLSATAPSSGGGHERPASAAAGTTVITLAGENKGASMKIDGAAVADGKADSAAGKERRGHKLDGSVAGGKEQAGSKGLTAFVNSNVQVINNSLLLQSSCNGGDPGVHLKLSTKSKKGDSGEEARGKSGSASAAAPKK